LILKFNKKEIYMLKKTTLMMITGLFLVDTQLHAFQVAIPVQDFCAGNSLVLIARDGNGDESVAGCVAFGEGKTEFSQDEISADNPILLSLAQQGSAIIRAVQHDAIDQNDEGIIYLYFDVDPSMDIVRVLVIKNNFLADKPFDVLEFSTTAGLDVDEDDEEDFFAMSAQDDELSHFNLEDIQSDRVELSYYDKAVLTVCALWAVQSTHARQAYKNMVKWFSSDRA
jgi:hypothetical protein